MGSGKGNPEGWVAVVKPGRVMFELAGVPEPLAREAMLPRRSTSCRSRPSSSRGWGTDDGERRPPSCASFPTTSCCRAGWSQRKEELFNLRFQLATGQLDNPARHQGRPSRRGARIATVLRERAIELELDATRPVSEAGERAVSDERRRRSKRGARKTRTGVVVSDKHGQDRPGPHRPAGATRAVRQDRAPLVEAGRARRDATMRTWATPSA